MPPVAKPYSRASVAAHISARVVVEPRGYETPCWIWQSGINGCGYATGRPSGCAHGGMHRHAYEAFVGPIPSGLQIDHLCKVRPCVNPAHLEAVTVSENLLRRGMKARNEARLAAAQNEGGGASQGERRPVITDHVRTHDGEASST